MAGAWTDFGNVSRKVTNGRTSGVPSYRWEHSVTLGRTCDRQGLSRHEWVRLHQLEGVQKVNGVDGAARLSLLSDRGLAVER